MSTTKYVECHKQGKKMKLETRLNRSVVFFNKKMQLTYIRSIPAAWKEERSSKRGSNSTERANMDMCPPQKIAKTKTMCWLSKTGNYCSQASTYYPTMDGSVKKFQFAWLFH